MFAERFEKAIRFFSENFKEELSAARAEYAALVGEFFEDDEFYEQRVQAFLEWFFFDRMLSSKGVVPVEYYLEHVELDEDESDFFEELADSLHSLFEVKSIKPAKELIELQDLQDLTRYKVKERRKPVGIESGDIIEARIFLHKGNFLFTSAICKHPRDVARIVKKEAKRLRKQDLFVEFDAWIYTLHKKRWFLERYPKADPKKVYQNDFKPEWFE